MTTQADHPATDRVPTGRAPGTPPRPTPPILWWAAVGAVFVAFALYVQGGWLLTDAHPVPTGVTPVPTYAKIAVIVNEVIFGIGILACVWFALVRPRIRDGRLSFEGLLFLAFMTVWWQDPLYNYLTTGFTYNAYFLNLGGWSERIPGWGSPNGKEFGEPLIWDFGFYAFLSFAGCLLAVWVLKRVKGRFPDLRDGVMWTAYFGFLLVADFIVEFNWVLTGCYSYAGTHDSWTIFPDRYYRFPLYEPILAAMLFIGWTALIFYRNDRGQTVVERGLEKVRTGVAGKQVLRFLALAGMLNLIFLVGNNVWVNAFQHQIDQWPADLQSRSYMTHGMCGEGTTYPCGGTNTSIPRGGAEIHVGPDGQLVVPPGAVAPTVVPLRR